MAQVECLLFVAGEPVPVKTLADMCGVAEPQVGAALDVLGRGLEEEGGLQLVELAGGYQLSTKPMYAELVARYLNPRKRRLSRAILETLAVIAYRQPITLAEIEIVRGVNSDYSVRALAEMNLVEPIGRRDTVGKPVLYATTKQFLHEFNLKGIEDLPPLEVAE